MHNFRQLVLALRQLNIPTASPILVHSSLSAFGHIPGGADAVLGALMQSFDTIIMPTFTYKTMVVPETGPPNNAIEYGSMSDGNRMAQLYHNDMPADKLMGWLPETLRVHRLACRSIHPILSFSGLNAGPILQTQTLTQPLAPIKAIMDQDGWVLLLGVGHTANTSIHLGERMAGRKTFVRWAAVSDSVVECPGFPGCSDGFDALQPAIQPHTRSRYLDRALIQAIPIPMLVRTVQQLLQADPLALLCQDSLCPRCNAVRSWASSLQN